MNAVELKNRTRQFAIDIIRFASPLLRDQVGSILGKQLIRCSTSVGANYRAACLAQSKVDMVAKLKIVEGEADEAIYWLELLEQSKLGSTDQIRILKIEAEELLRIMVASITILKKTALRIEIKQTAS